MSPSETNGVANGSAEPMTHLVNGAVKGEKQHEDEDLLLVVQSFRLLIADLCEQFNMGHPGGAMGMAAIGVALWKYAMVYAPHQPEWFNRDRFLLSNGHACLFQYANLYLSGYKAMTWEQLKSYHSERSDSLCPGHPEIEIEGIEMTTGPLGQGIGNAVGLAMASKQLAAQYNKPDYPVVSNHIWCMVGDACMQEGIGCEAFSLAGHWRLSNLTCIYDNNQVSCDGTIDMVNTEDVNTKMRACGWDVVDVMDGRTDVNSIVAALALSKQPGREKPLFINVRTVIGMDSAVQGMAIAHGAPLGKDNVVEMKKKYGWDPEKHFHIPEKVTEFYKEIPERGDKHVANWNKLVEAYSKEHPDLAAEFKSRMRGDLDPSWKDLIPKDMGSDDLPTRKSNNKIVAPIFEKFKQFVVGTADLTPSVNLGWKDQVPFQHPDLRTDVGIDGNYSGRYIHYGIREHVMCAIANAFAAYSPGTFIPVTSSFLMFYIYAAAAVRMGALQHLHVIHVATHDSIGAGEDGPTHQPIELAAMFRAMPNFLFMRPGDGEEAAGAWQVAIAHKDPSMISVSRHNIPQTGVTDRNKVAKGGYVIKEVENADVTLISSGAELSFTLNVSKWLEENKGVKARCVSFPCQRLFDKQDRAYRRSVLKRHEGIPAVVIEPYSPLGWERYCDAGMNMRKFGHSLPGKYIYQHFGFTTENMSKKVVEFLDDWKSGDLKGEYVDLMSSHYEGIPLR